LPRVVIVFDLDGTLIDSRRDLADATNALVAERGGTPLPVETVAGMVGEGASVLVARALTAAGLDDRDPTALRRFLELYDERLLIHTHLYEGIDEVLDALAARSAALGVLTNKPLAATREILDGLAIAHRFRWVMGGDGPQPRKPDPAGLLAICADAGVEPRDATLVGDSPVDVATARAAGTRICVARYGFGFRRGHASLDGSERFADTPLDILQLLTD
jgi:phosphoglycolate phosphatase